MTLKITKWLVVGYEEKKETGFFDVNPKSWTV